MGSQNVGCGVSDVRLLDVKVITARSEHRCILCAATIEPGAKYRRTKGIYDGAFFASAECVPCLEDGIWAAVYVWSSHPDDGIDAELVHEWASEIVEFGNAHAKYAEAKRLLARFGLIGGGVAA